MQRQLQATRATMGPSIVIGETGTYHERDNETLDPTRSNAPQGVVVVGTLRLRGGPVSDRRVTWGEDVIDNEAMGKKKSKICCIFHKQRAFDESSSDESSSSDDESSSGSDSDDNGDSKGEHREHAERCEHDHAHRHGRRARQRKPNAYERQPKYGKKVPRAQQQ
ncbi:phosphatase inhibitor-domain-containing protein [Lipomyces orientalis]|uniref:Phosphatase inhibitor-domain-containing protein n=1 Tax=Lipomyces orientalis TaxID=1233043 RepID=A0ACC3TYI4_9ASCO